jgi:hypothetical protein
MIAVATIEEAEAILDELVSEIERQTAVITADIEVARDALRAEGYLF